MDIVEIIPERIYSIRYDGQEYAEYYRLFNCEWTDVEYLMRFFESHTEFTENEFWNFLDNNPETAAARVIEDANRLEPYLRELAENSENGETPDLEDYFEPLNGKYVYELKFIPMKGYGMSRPTFLRLYALKFERNRYLIVYGGIKLNDSIQDSPVLSENVFKKIDQVRQFLKDEFIQNIDDI